MLRRNLLIALGVGVLGILTGALRWINPLFKIFPKKPDHRFVRPPGTYDEKTFLARCIRCRACANVCEAGCIKFFSFTESPSYAGTPYLNTRLRACNLCMNCTQVCPTAALEPIKRELPEIKEKVKMGVAKVYESNCLSFNGRICGVCHDACPVKGEAIKLEPKARPVVYKDACIGCGRCEERCPQIPAAIVVYPNNQMGKKVTHA